MQIYNLFKGFYWIVFPLLCVPVNSALASFVGLAIGRTPLNQHRMPTKTMEGYIGGIILTAVWAYFASGYLAQFQYLRCPQGQLSLYIFEGLTCEETPVFALRTVTIEDFLWSGSTFTFSQRPIQVHSVYVSIFASMIAPFGQFIIDGFKKAFNIRVTNAFFMIIYSPSHMQWRWKGVFATY